VSLSWLRPTKNISLILNADIFVGIMFILEDWRTRELTCLNTLKRNGLHLDKKENHLTTSRCQSPYYTIRVRSKMDTHRHIFHVASNHVANSHLHFLEKLIFLHSFSKNVIEHGIRCLNECCEERKCHRVACSYGFHPNIIGWNWFLSHLFCEINI
jgi:hypothetical protein